MRKLGTRKTRKMQPAERKAYQEHRLAQTEEAYAMLKAHAAKVREARDAKGLTLRALSNEVGCSVNQLHNLEAARNWPSMVVYIRLCHALGMKTPPLL